MFSVLSVSYAIDCDSFDRFLFHLQMLPLLSLNSQALNIFPFSCISWQLVLTMSWLSVALLTRVWVIVWRGIMGESDGGDQVGVSLIGRHQLWSSADICFVYVSYYKHGGRGETRCDEEQEYRLG